ncbi:acyl-CoA dehydrogenase family protein [Acanthopleuribacter pedis]|uniref:Acyl-CoA dehydrogenase family protein n=1 Tax=Acanthopleuribacter pedis TaxID=442870 RepID=A0A8J7U229_9BACT|nr:acyl-CoA dehydrogenase family protein [Acanthopleuribacter pedis]MBO1318828.1 acyl-CoA dehydrogenase family protein [Acanthopleuribacter pedis]
MKKGVNTADFFGIDHLLTEEELMVRDSVKNWVSKRFLPVINQHNRDATFPMNLVPELAELNVFGANIDGYGCPGLNNVAYGLIMQELERGDSGLRSFVSVQGALVMYPILAYGSEEQKNEFLPKLATAEMIGCFGLTEPDHGSDPGSMKTNAKRDGDNWILNGAKMWITNGSIAQIAIVWARDEEGVVRGFIVDTDSKGFSAPEMKGKYSLRASVTSELVLDDVVVPDSRRLPNVEGLKGPLGCLTQARYGISWGALGAAMACYDATVDYTKSRIQFDRPLASFQLVQGKLADMLTEIVKGQLMSLHLGRMKDDGTYNFAQVSMAKMNNVAIALDIARQARDMHGANGITDEYPVIRHMLNLETVKTYEGTHDIHRLIIGQAITGIPAFA